MSDTERSTIAHKASELTRLLAQGERYQRVQGAAFMNGYWRSVAEQAVAELQKISRGNQ